MLCKERDPAGDPQGDETEPLFPLEPIPIRTKADATIACHTYVFPVMRMDCSNRGKLSISFLSDEPVWVIVSCFLLFFKAHVSYVTEGWGGICLRLLVRALICSWLTSAVAILEWLNFPPLKGFSGQIPNWQRHIWFGRCCLFNVILLIPVTSDGLQHIVIFLPTKNKWEE